MTPPVVRAYQWGLANAGGYMHKLFLVAALFLGNAALADVTLFQAGKAPARIKEDLKLSTSALDGTKLNKGTASQEVLRFVAQNKARFGLTEINGETVLLRNRTGSDKGFALRFIQRYHRVHIEGAELVALFGWDGKLKALNSSLMPEPPKFTVNPTITRKQAFQIAASELKYRDPEAGEDYNDGLLIVNDRGRPRLVWQVSIRENATARRAMGVQVNAGADNSGKIYRAINIAHSAANGDVNIYDASVTVVMPNPLLKGVHVLKNGKPTLAGRVLVSSEAKSASQNFQRVQQFYLQTEGRKSWDGKGANVDASVNVQKFTFLDVLGLKQNAAWMGPWKMFVFGAGGEELGDFAGALDVVGHEYTHAVIGSTSNLQYVGESGALNEHLADLFGAMIEERFDRRPRPFLIGDTLLRGKLRDKADALRDMLEPEEGLKPQPAHMEQYPPEFKLCKPAPGNDNCGVHILSGIPNKAIALAIESLGWETVRPLFYRVMTQRLRTSSNFADYRNQVLDECKAQLQEGQCFSIERAFSKVGL